MLVLCLQVFLLLWLLVPLFMQSVPPNGRANMGDLLHPEDTLEFGLTGSEVKCEDWDWPVLAVPVQFFVLSLFFLF
ncbi:hypothetical protein ACS0TY_022695 [Phlomoides rotata]